MDEIAKMIEGLQAAVKNRDVLTKALNEQRARYVALIAEVDEQLEVLARGVGRPKGSKTRKPKAAATAPAA